MTYMITLSIGESRRSTEGGRPGDDAAEEPPRTTAAASRVIPKVIDKTKGIQMSTYPVYKVPSVGQVMRTDQRTDHLTKLDLNIGRRHYLNPMAA